MKIKIYTTSWKITNSEISFVPDFGIFNKCGIYFKWLGISLIIRKNN